LAHELKNAAARRVIAVLPYFGYSRQEKSNIPHGTGHAVVIAKLLEASGIDGLITVELHNPIIQTFFSIPVHNVMVSDDITHHIAQHINMLEGACFIAPDEGAAQRVYAVAVQFGAGVIVYKKERYGANKTRVIGKVGDCVSDTAIIIDDIIDTGGTALDVCKKLKEDGFKTIYGYFVHPVLSPHAVVKLERGLIDYVLVSNTIGLSEEKCISKIAIFDVSSAVVNAIIQMIQK
ncbi:MAG: ribose-phosphate diphosphokinase, partial [bacterium]|nr:ribose-phosphate diphosphokinase [bacterium]